MKVLLSAEAVQDLTRIGDYIARDNPRRALGFVHDLRAKALELADMPRAFPLVPRYESAGLRRRPYRDYLIFYRVDADQVSIVHILHGAQDYESLLFRRD